MTQILNLFDKEFKIAMINILKLLEEKTCQIKWMIVAGRLKIYIRIK